MSTWCPGGAFLTVELVGLDLLGKGQVDETHVRPHFQARADGDQLGRELANGVVGRLAIRRTVGPLANVGRIEGHGHPRLVMDQERQQRRGIAGPFDQHAFGPQLPDEPAHVPGAGRAVMPHREVDDPAQEVDGRGELIGQDHGCIPDDRT